LKKSSKSLNPTKIEEEFLYIRVFQNFLPSALV